jgi:quercetin 2,3-dioxygenase
MRKIKKIYKTMSVLEGAGVRLNRGFSNREAEVFDPFLLFDDFSNTEASNYEAGFPQHPHRGMETVTYILKGEVHHRDSLGNEGSIKAGEVQWMTAGSGIIHEEMPVVHEEGIRGFQLWVNIPAEHKMMSPRYQEITASQIPVVEREGVVVRVIAGEYENVRGPVEDLMTAPIYLDVILASQTRFDLETKSGDTCFIYVFEGRVMFRDAHDRSEFWVKAGEIALLTNDSTLMCTAGNEGARFLLVSGRPLREPIAWYGPIVMNTQEEIDLAFKELREGTFIKK